VTDDGHNEKTQEFRKLRLKSNKKYDDYFESMFIRHSKSYYAIDISYAKSCKFIWFIL